MSQPRVSLPSILEHVRRLRRAEAVPGGEAIGAGVGPGGILQCMAFGWRLRTARRSRGGRGTLSRPQAYFYAGGRRAHWRCKAGQSPLPGPLVIRCGASGRDVRARPGKWLAGGVCPVERLRPGVSGAPMRWRPHPPVWCRDLGRVEVGTLQTDRAMDGACAPLEVGVSDAVQVVASPRSQLETMPLNCSSFPPQVQGTGHGGMLCRPRLELLLCWLAAAGGGTRAIPNGGAGGGWLEGIAPA